MKKVDNIIRNYNCEEIYEKEIQPLVEELRRVCHANKIPMYFTAAVASNGKEVTYKQEAVTVFDVGVELEENRIASMMQLSNGFIVVQKHKLPVFESDDLHAPEIEFE